MGDTLGQRLREAMDRQDMTPASLARAADTTEATVSGWLRDIVKPDHVKAVQLFKIADAAQMSPRACSSAVRQLNAFLRTTPNIGLIPSDVRFLSWLSSW
jgi:transcriptional regulator with XRE-family HTH domain